MRLINKAIHGQEYTDNFKEANEKKKKYVVHIPINSKI